MASRLTDVFIFEVRGFVQPLFNKFPRSFPEYAQLIESQANMVLGPEWKETLDAAQGWKGAVDWFLKQMWDQFYTVYEAAGELNYMWEILMHEELARNPGPTRPGEEPRRLGPWKFWMIEQAYRHFQIVRGKATFPPKNTPYDNQGSIEARNKGLEYDEDGVPVSLVSPAPDGADDWGPRLSRPLDPSYFEYPGRISRDEFTED